MSIVTDESKRTKQENIHKKTQEEENMKYCYQCGETLNQDGECPNGCTENPDYFASTELVDDEDDLPEDYFEPRPL